MTQQWSLLIGWLIVSVPPTVLAVTQAFRRKCPPRWFGARGADYRFYAAGTILYALAMSAVFVAVALHGRSWLVGGAVTGVLALFLRRRKPASPQRLRR